MCYTLDSLCLVSCELRLQLHAHLFLTLFVVPDPGYGGPAEASEHIVFPRKPTVARESRHLFSVLLVYSMFVLAPGMASDF